MIRNEKDEVIILTIKYENSFTQVETTVTNKLDNPDIEGIILSIQGALVAFGFSPKTVERYIPDF